MAQLTKGSLIEANDKLSWYPAIVLDVQDDGIKIHYFGWDERYDEVLPTTDPRINIGPPAHTHEYGGLGSLHLRRWVNPCQVCAGVMDKVKDFKYREEPISAYTGNQVEDAAIGDMLDCYDTVKKIYPVLVTDVRVVEGQKEVKVHFFGWTEKYDEWIPLKSLRISPFSTNSSDYGETSSHVLPSNKCPHCAQMMDKVSYYEIGRIRPEPLKLSVGDLIDAWYSGGNCFYPAYVKEVHQNKVTVHFFGHDADTTYQLWSARLDPFLAHKYEYGYISDHWGQTSSCEMCRKIYPWVRGATFSGRILENTAIEYHFLVHYNDHSYSVVSKPFLIEDVHEDVAKELGIPKYHLHLEIFDDKFSKWVRLTRLEQLTKLNTELRAHRTVLKSANQANDSLTDFVIGKDILPTGGAWSPTCDVKETSTEFVIHAELPGVKKENLHVDLHNRILTISGERRHVKKEDDEKHHKTERFYGKFVRSLLLPDGVDSEKIQASLEDGVLQVTLPKTTTNVASRKIAVA